MGHVGFSYTGCVYLLLLFIPNGIWAKYKPEGYDALTAGEPKILRLLEGLGQVLTACCALVFTDFNPRGWSLWSLWLGASFFCMALYEAGWIRYFAGGHTLRNMYHRLTRGNTPASGPNRGWTSFSDLAGDSPPASCGLASPYLGSLAGPSEFFGSENRRWQGRRGSRAVARQRG